MTLCLGIGVHAGGPGLHDEQQEPARPREQVQPEQVQPEQGKPKPEIRLRRGLLLHFACDHERPVALDTSGHNHHGELDGAKFEKVDGKFALAFAGKPDRGDTVRVHHTKILARASETGALTLALWLKSRSEPHEFPDLLCKGGNHRPAWGGFELHLNTHADNDLQVTSGPFTAVTYRAFGKWIDKRQGQWIHVAFSMAKDGKATFYVNGKATGDTHLYRTRLRDALAKETRDLFVGGPDPDHHDNRSWFDGWLDEIRIYDRVLTRHEVAALHEHGR